MPSEPVAHEVEVRTRLARTSDLDVYYARCSCGWTGEERTAGKGGRVQRVNWDAAWDEADAHLAGFTPG